MIARKLGKNNADSKKTTFISIRSFCLNVPKFILKNKKYRIKKQNSKPPINAAISLVYHRIDHMKVNG